MNHGGRASDQAGIVESPDIASLKIPVVQPGFYHALIKWCRPLDPADAPHAIELRILQRLHIVDKLHLRIHDPDIGIRQICNGPVRARHQTAEDAQLLRNQQRGESDAQDDAKIFRTVTDKHFERDPIHEPVNICRRRLCVKQENAETG